MVSSDSRPNSFAIYNEASSDQSISSLHESDETNETDADSFWSDYLESGEGPLVRMVSCPVNSFPDLQVEVAQLKAI